MPPRETVSSTWTVTSSYSVWVVEPVNYYLVLPYLLQALPELKLSWELRVSQVLWMLPELSVPLVLKWLESELVPLLEST